VLNKGQVGFFKGPLRKFCGHYGFPDTWPIGVNCQGSEGSCVYYWMA